MRQIPAHLIQLGSVARGVAERLSSDLDWRKTACGRDWGPTAIYRAESPSQGKVPPPHLRDGCAGRRLECGGKRMTPQTYPARTPLFGLAELSGVPRAARQRRAAPPTARHLSRRDRLCGDAVSLLPASEGTRAPDPGSRSLQFASA